MAKIVTSSKEIAKDTLDFTTKRASQDIDSTMKKLRKAAKVFLGRLKDILAKVNITNISYHQNSFIDEISSNLMDNTDIDSSLRGKIYLAVLDFERAIYEIMHWKLIFTYVKQDGTVLFAKQGYLKDVLYENVKVGGKPSFKIEDLQDWSKKKKLNEKALSDLKSKNDNTKKQYFQETLNRFNESKRLVTDARQTLKTRYDQGKSSLDVKIKQIHNSYLYYKDNSNKYHFYNNTDKPYVPKDTDIEKIILHIERRYIQEIEVNKKKCVPKEKGQKEEFPNKINRGHISEGYVRFLASEEEIPKKISSEQGIEKIMSYIRNDSVSQLFGGDVQIQKKQKDTQIQKKQEDIHLQLSVKSFSFSLASYKPFIALAQVITQEPNGKITSDAIKDFMNSGRKGEITLTGNVGQMLVENIRKNLLPQGNKNLTK